MAGNFANSYTSVTWTTGDLLTETKLDNMVNNDQSHDAFAAEGLLLNNTVELKGVDTGASNRTLIKLDANDNVVIGDSGLTRKEYGVWQSYTPTWSSTGTNPTVGNGTLSGSYCYIGDTVFFHVELTIGSTTSAGTGTYGMSLPVAVGSEYNEDMVIANAMWFESGVAFYSGDCYYDGSQLFRGVPDGGGQWGPATPYSPSSGDTASFNGFYTV